MRRFGNAAALRLHRATRYVGRATVRGHLYLSSRYPVLELNDDGPPVHGEIFELRGSAQLLAFLDRYEGCSPADAKPHLYKRTHVLAALATGDLVHAWVYVLNGSPRRMARISGGRYRPSPRARARSAPRRNQRRPQSGA